MPVNIFSKLEPWHCKLKIALQEYLQRLHGVWASISGGGGIVSTQVFCGKWREGFKKRDVKSGMNSVSRGELELIGDFVDLPLYDE